MNEATIPRIEIVVGWTEGNGLNFRSTSLRLDATENGPRLKVPKDAIDGIEVELVPEPPLRLTDVRDGGGTTWRPRRGRFVSTPLRDGTRLQLDCAFVDPGSDDRNAEVKSGVGFIEVEDEGGGGL